MEVFDTSVATGKGIVRGMGLQKYAAWILFFAYWIVTLPTSATLVIAFDYGVFTVWKLQIVGAAISFAGVFGIALFADWEKVLASIQERLRITAKQNNSLKE